MFLKANSTKASSIHLYKHKQQGSALVMAIFIIVVVLLLATALVNMLSSSSNTIAYQVVGTRAFAAANSGAEMRLKALFPLKPDVHQRCDSSDLPGDTNDIVPYDTISNTAGLNNCSIIVSCKDFEHNSVIYYQIESTGTCNLDGNSQTSRTVVVEARSL